jgi:hypothetical protein
MFVGVRFLKAFVAVSRIGVRRTVEADGAITQVTDVEIPVRCGIDDDDGDIAVPTVNLKSAAARLTTYRACFTHVISVGLFRPLRRFRTALESAVQTLKAGYCF